MKNRIDREKIKLLMFLCLVLSLVFPAWAGGPAGMTACASQGDGQRRVYDGADLYSDEQEADLEERIAEAREQAGFDIVLVTTDYAEGKSARDYADDIYDEGGFGEGGDHSGILFLIDMDNRELYFSTAGSAIRIFEDSRIENMLDHVYDGASEGDFEACADAYLEDVLYYAKKGISAGQYNYDSETGKISVYRSITAKEFLIALGIALAVAYMAAQEVTKEYNMTASADQIANHNMAYRADSHVSFTENRKEFLGIFETTAIIQTAKQSGFGGSSHESTTHTSSSGTTHGGGGRSF